MRAVFFLLLLLPSFLSAQQVTSKEITEWENQAKNSTIIRDDMGIPHIYGKSDADAVFGLLYAQCEDDFARVEMNYIEKLGRLAEVQGESKLYDDLLIRLIIDSAEAKRDYAKAPVWLKKLCQAFADGINYYLHKNPSVKPALLTRFQPWYPLLWTDGSIGAISTADINLQEVKQLYDSASPLVRSESTTFSSSAHTVFEEPVPTGSNGFAIAPSQSVSGKALLYINPHVSFYFRPEVHMVSEEGLNAYGAVTWGQFFIYQGFNENAGWMHTSCYVDAADTYIEDVEERPYGWAYRYEGKLRRVKTKSIPLRYKNSEGWQQKNIVAYYTHHGPIMAKRNNQYLSMKADNRLMEGLIQCWNRTKVHGLADFKKTLDLKGNISNSTVYADKEGNIAYWHGNRIPKRNPALDWTQPMDGTTKATEWQGYHSINETVHQINPPNGWLQHCNSSPFFMSGKNSPNPADFPVYMAPDGDNFRGINAVRTISEQGKFDLDQLIKAGYDPRLAAFEELIPALIKSFDNSLQSNDTLFAWLAGPITVLRNWDFKTDTSSIATTLAVEWGQRILPTLMAIKAADGKQPDLVQRVRIYIRQVPAREQLQVLYATITDLQARYGKWQLPWGSINRFQRISPAIELEFDDTKTSYPVGFASGTWGMLPSYNSRIFKGTKNRYGIHGNSFVCAVEFGDRVKAKALLAGGQSGDPGSPHFNDQVEAYSTGRFRDVLFYKEDVMKNAERTYHPGN
ncbi:penicillin acylase family protein [Flavihumibacter sp. UBA7668]|uniref:penicillin acylase family protein n=1 Tax=Flavihumibacter sp. UBA7668 TaxID=1946542 RepID=UPI0025BE6C06|nr:penicillin acylase family protein [Flavihumibacter sp. UBA7668]